MALSKEVIVKNNVSVRYLAVAASLFFASVAAPLPAADPTVTVMTRNLYVGGDVGAAVGAISSGDPETIVAAVSEVWARVRFTNFPARAEAIASEIEKAQPDLIGLQEAELWRSQTPSDFVSGNAEYVECDFVETLLHALATRGLRYEVVAEETGFDIEMPGFLSQRAMDKGLLSDIRLTDREVILARSDRTELRLSNVRTGHFATNLEYPVSAGSPFVVLRGWAAVDVALDNRTFRFVTTHLEADDEGVREAQALEVITGPASTDLPVVLVADANSNANGDSTTPAYCSFLGAGFVDAWLGIYSAAQRNPVAPRRRIPVCPASTPRESPSRSSPFVVLPRATGGPFGSPALAGCSPGLNFSPSGACEEETAGSGAPIVSTCCNAEPLTNSSFPVETDDEGRIDLILYRGASAFAPVQIGLLGTSAPDRVFNGITEIWASDHAGVAATFEIRR